LSDADAGLRDALGELTAGTTKRSAANVEAAHLIAMTELARGIARTPAEPRPPAAGGSREARSTQRRFTLGLLTPILALLGIIAIAFAGANLPHALRGPLEAAGITLPNQLRPGGFGGLVDRAIPLRGAGTLRIHGARRAGKRRGVAAHQSPHKRSPSPAHAAASKGTSSGTVDGSGQFVVNAQQTASPAPSGAPPASPSPSSSSGGGQPSPPSPPSGTTKAAPTPVPTLPTRPGKGCGDKNHIHARAQECH
jgi:hypothetical protein